MDEINPNKAGFFEGRIFRSSSIFHISRRTYLISMLKEKKLLTSSVVRLHH